MIPLTLHIRTLLLGAVLTALVFGLALARSPAVALGKRPNIILIQTDDQAKSTFKGHFRGPNGKRQRIMPNMVRGIVQGGAEFRNYYAATPVCSPSRASLLTGQYPENSGLLRNSGIDGGWSGWQAIPAWENNVPVTMQRAGYRTSHFGKILNGYHRGTGRAEHVVPPGWDRWFTVSFVRSTPYYGYKVNNDGIVQGPFGDPRYIPGKRGTDPAACRSSTKRAPNGRRCLYLTDMVTRRALKEIRRHGRRGVRPFFMQIDFQAPHGDNRPPDGPAPPTRYAGSASRTKLPRPPSFNELDMSDKPAHLREAARRRLGPNKIHRLKKYYQRYVESLRGVDDGVGEILKTLRKTGQLDNTYIFYLTDHGLFFGEHRFDQAKFLPYDPAAKVGMAVRGPGVRPGTKVNEIVGNIDVPATVLRLGGANPQYQVDGRPLKRFWRNPWQSTRRPFQISLFGVNEPGDLVVNRASAVTSNKAPAISYRGFRVGPYKYIRYRNGERELYDLSRDPSELRNRIDRPAYAEVQRYMRSHLAQVTECRGEECRAELPPWPLPGE